MTDSGRSTGEVEQIIARAPRRIRPAVDWVMGSWLGRSLLRLATRFVRLELFDRSMTVAAQVFTSVFPILIMAAVFLSSRYDTAIADAIEVPEETENILQDALASTGGSAFGVIGTLVVLISATSLSRALTRAFAAIWDLPRPKTGVVLAWRWLGVVLIVAGYLVLIRWLIRAVEGLAAADVWSWLVPLILDTAIATLVPYLLLAGQLSARRLLPGAFVFGLIMLALRPASSAFLPHALDVSADRYGTIGVAFTYIAWLYAMSFCFLVAALIGQVITTDDGWLGRLIRGLQDEPEPVAVSPSEAPGPTSRG
ncbi:MAG TPA: YhjD/YihY/BrkB family envelope integrity protein [Jiangellaceae bacterium]|nr:YhjD/YihY/BrkB family envelope integrity protein [Jiangellaceae bacterium]